MSKNFLQGAVIITVASLISKILGSVFRIPLQNIGGNEVFGIFTIVYPVYMVLLILSVAGIPLSISKLISEARANHNQTGIRDIFVTSSILGLIFGVSSFVIVIILSNPLSALLGGEYARFSLITASMALLVVPYMAVYRGFFQGFDDMKPTAISQVLEQFVRVGFILVIAYFLVHLGYEPPIVAGGVMIGSLFGAATSLVYLRKKFVHAPMKLQISEKYSFDTFKTWSKKILLLSLPICIGALTMALVNLIDSITVPRLLTTIGYEVMAVPEIYSYYGRGQALVQIAVVFAQALTLPLIPLISGAMAKRDLTRTTYITEKALKYTHMTAWPATIGLFVLTVPLNVALFGDAQESAVIALVHLSALFTAIAVLTTGILQGMNRLVSSAIIVATVSMLKVILNIILIQQFGLIGIAGSTLIVYIVLSGLNLWLMRRTVRMSLWKRDYLVFAGSAIVMGIVVSFPLTWVDPSAWSRNHALMYVGVMAIVGLIVYGAMIISLKGISKDEFKQLTNDE